MILRSRTLFDRIANNIRSTAIWNIDRKASIAVGIVNDQIIADVGPVCPALDFMANHRSMKVTEPNRYLATVADIDVVLKTCIAASLYSIMIEFTGLDQKFSGGIVAC